MKLLAVLLLLGMFSLSVAEVVHSFKETCPQFFIRDNNKKAVPPTVLEGDQYKQICQFYEGEYRFATLYDTIHRIPVYSAYTYSFTDPKGIDYNDWKIEPQLDDPKTNREMRREKAEEEGQILKQALDRDYKNSGYTRGHVFPKSYAQGDPQKKSTFTFTNAAPQIKKSNEEWAKQVEEPMLNEIKGNCDQNSLVYIVTGVVPGETWLPIERGKKKIVHGVNIPRYYWTTFSCKSKDKRDKNVSNAYIAQQITDPSTGTTDFTKEIMAVYKLNENLEKHYNKSPFRVFG